MGGAVRGRRRRAPPAPSRRPARAGAEAILAAPHGVARDRAGCGDRAHDRLDAAHFARRFADEFGLSPKLAARVVRFDYARRMLQRTPALVSIAQVAAVCGYYDQAHMTRDFVELAGCPPGRLLVEDDLPSFQDADGAPRT